MATFYLNPRRHRYRSTSAPPAPSAVEATQRLSTATAAGETEDVETATYREARQRSAVLSLAAACSDECSATHHRVRWRRSTFRRSELARRLADAEIDLDQQLLYLRFRLAGPDPVRFLPDDDARGAAACLRRAQAEAISPAAALMQRTGYLWDRRGGGGESTETVATTATTMTTTTATTAITREKPRALTTAEQEERARRHAQLRADDALFWAQARPQFDALLETLRQEVLRMRYVVYCLDNVKKQEARYFQVGGSSSSPTDTIQRLLLCDLASAIPRQQPAPPRVEMSGALPGPSGVRDEGPGTLVDRLRTRFGGSKTDDEPVAAEAPAGIWLRYKMVKRGDKNRSPEQSRAAWEAFRRELESMARPFNSGTALLRNKVNTKIILADHQMRELAGAGGEK
ncbi:hypothetical protein GGR52DRAFT_588206 [Hypoxylon sp. FL1284]|nr:hypothetical protein GGR52DRAFT_588206 [Hypoxylon sp. FL1284]